MTTNNDLPLGKNVAYPSNYDAGLLVPIKRQINREKLGIALPLPFDGVDIWNAWELSWLNHRGKPQVAMGEIEIPCTSQNIIESKSLKLYLNSLNQTRFSSIQEVRDMMHRDLSMAAVGAVNITIKPDMTNPSNWVDLQKSYWSESINLDQLDITCETYQPAPELLQLKPGGMQVTQQLSSHLLKTNCPVTGQPDWATLFIQYRGYEIDKESLLRYIVSLREHQDFHEHCVETIFMTIQERCRPQTLAVYARYTRRGGLDINPLRSNFEVARDNPILARQ